MEYDSTQCSIKVCVLIGREDGQEWGILNTVDPGEFKNSIEDSLTQCYRYLSSWFSIYPDMQFKCGTVDRSECNSCREKNFLTSFVQA